MYFRVLCLCLGLLPSLSARAAELAADYQAGLAGTPAPSPVAGGWVAGAAPADAANFQSAAVAPDGSTGYNAWRMLDNSTATSQFLTWNKSLTADRHSVAAANGWRLATRLRVADPVTGNAGTNSIVLLYGNNAGKRWILFFDLNAAGQIVTTMTGGPTVTLTGLDAAAYHEHQIVQDPVSGTAEYLVDGVSKATGYAGTTGSFDGVQWGTGSSGGRGDGYWNSVSFVINDPPLPPRPAVTVHPTSISVAEGGSVTLTSAFSGSGYTRQWFKNALPLSGADGAGLTLNAITPADAGDYWCRAVNAAGSASTATAAVAVLTATGGLTLSEFLAENDKGLRDRDGQRSDWIEIRNTSTLQQSTAGWALTDKATLPAKWPMPALTVAPGGFLHVWASGKNRGASAGDLHANFALQNSGGYLALTKPDLSVATAYSYPPQYADDSYGLTEQIPAQIKYFSLPSPGGLNSDGQTSVKDGITFAPTPGVFSNLVTVNVSATGLGGTLRCSIDGTRPQFDSTACAGPLTLTDSTQLRAAMVYPGERYGAAASGAWLRAATDVQGFRSPLPMVILSNHGAGAIPGVSARGPNGDGSAVVGVALQPQSLIILDETSGETTLTSPAVARSRAGLKVRGSSSFTFAEKSYSLETRGEHDGEERDLPLLGMTANADWVLYGPDPAQFDNTFLHNTMAYELARVSGFTAPHFRFVELFLDSGGDLTMADHRGLAILMEKPARGKDRVDFSYLNADGSAGGWMISVDRMDSLPPGSVPGSLTPRHFHTAGPDGIRQTPHDNPFGYQGILTPGGAGSGSGVTPANDDMPNFYHSFFNFESPSGWSVTAPQRAMIESQVQAFDTALYGASYQNAVTGYGPHIDVQNWAHHLLLQAFTKNQDAIVLSAYLYREAAGAPLRWATIWDFDRAFDRNTTSGSTGNAALTWAHDRLYYSRLVTDPEFMQAYQDKWQELRRTVWTDSALTAMVDGQVAEITPAVAARSGLTAPAWTANLNTMKSWMSVRASAMDAQYPALPVFSQAEGAVAAGTQVSVTAAAGTIYYTLDGTDPRQRGGQPAASAVIYGAPLTVSGPMKLSARLRSGTVWSGLRSAFYFPPQNLAALKASEISYHPPGTVSPLVDGDEFEFLELKNTGATPLDLSGVAFTSGITFAFPQGTVLAAGGFAVLVRNADAFASRYPGCVVAGIYSDKLSNSGETLTLSIAGEVIWSFAYGDRSPWRSEADGSGPSLQRPFPAAPGYDVATWTAAWPTPCADLSLTDSDSDGMPDYWELLHGFNPAVADASGDADGDGASNAAEYAAGTDPRNAASVFALRPVFSGAAAVEFTALAGRSYRVESSADLLSWLPLREIAAGSDTRAERTADPAPGLRRYYRVRTPGNGSAN